MIKVRITESVRGVHAELPYGGLINTWSVEGMLSALQNWYGCAFHAVTVWRVTRELGQSGESQVEVSEG